MGMINIFESNIAQKSQNVLAKVGQKLPNLQIDTSKYNQTFVKMMMLIGIVTTSKLVISGFKAISSLKKPKPLSQKDIESKYGKNTWALVVDVRRNQNYCLYLARHGVNLILMGEEDDIGIAKDMLNFQTDDATILEYEVDWSRKDFDYESLKQQLKDLNIAFMIMPKIEEPDEESDHTHLQQVIPFEHSYLMYRHFGPVLQWRCYKSAIIFPSSKNVNKLIKGSGVRQGLKSCMDSFFRAQNFEVENRLEIIVNRGGLVEGCFASLGKVPVYE